MIIAHHAWIPLILGKIRNSALSWNQSDCSIHRILPACTLKKKHLFPLSLVDLWLQLQGLILALTKSHRLFIVYMYHI